MSGLIIEGVCASGKTTILNKLIKRPSYVSKQNKIQLNEYLTERIIENLNPSPQQRVDLLKDYVDMISKAHNNFNRSRFKDVVNSYIKPCYILERFHFTHGVEVGDFYPFKKIDYDLNNLDFKVIILTMDEDIIKERINDTFQRRPKTWYNYVMSFGGLDGAANKYIMMQRKLLELSKESILPIHVIDTSKGLWEDYVNEAEEIWDI